MSSSRYPVGTKLVWEDVAGIVIPNFKIPGDICVRWENGFETSYDEEVLDEYVTILSDEESLEESLERLVNHNVD